MACIAVPPLPAVLAGTRSLRDLHELILRAGHSPELAWLPAEGWLDHDGPRGAAVIGRHGGFEWLGFETDRDPSALAGRLARRLERGARLVGVMVLCDRRRSLALSVSLPPRPVLLVDLDHPAPLALACLERLRAAGAGGAFSIAAGVARALDGESVGHRFFTGFRETLGRAVALLPEAMPASDRHGIALLLLTRVLFLYFVQAKGWLDGRPAFLREELDAVLARGGDPHRGLLHPLFFGTLNQPASRRGAASRRFGRVPFLNGGLFEPHPLERRWRVGLPSGFWREAVDELFERFHFTPREVDQAGRIAPDMLGRVFEGVMDPVERSGSGTFFTPAPLVADLIRATLAAHLAVRLRCPEPEAERRLDAPDPAARAVLERLTLLDPACGSGAFLLGALEMLSRTRTESPLSARHRVLARNLFGVDQNPAAVRLTELRLWLALIACDTAEDPAEVAPLPNLDSLVRQGDSLLEPLGPGWGGRLPAETALRLGALRRQLLVGTGPAKAHAVRALRQGELEAASTMMQSAEAVLRHQMSDLVAQGRSATLFGARAGLDLAGRRRLEALRGQRRFLWSLRRRLVRDEALPWFHFQTQFSEVFADRGGFDLIVGNPPWVRFEDLQPAVRHYLAARYRWYRSPRNQPGYGKRPDLSVAFLERAVELLAEDGTVGLLLPAKLATAGYGGVARAALASRTTIHCAADLTRDPRATFEATVYPLALIASRRPPGRDHRVRTRLEVGTEAELEQETRLSGSPWILAASGARAARHRLLAGMATVSDRFRIHLGVKTGLNQVFLDPVVAIEPELLHWAIRGRDVRPFGITPRCRLLWTHDRSGRPLASLPPAAAAYFAAHRDRLRRRRDYAGGPDWTVFRTVPATAPHRVIWADLSRRLEASPLTGPQAERLIPLNTCYLIPVTDQPEALRLAAWLNCTWVRGLAALTADPAASGFRRFNAGVVASLPLPPAVLADHGLAALALKGQGGGLDQRELDEACARHLPLTPADRDALAASVPPGPDRR